MQRRVSRRLCLEGDLRDALEARQLHVLYQPIIDLETGKLTSVEALVRWTHPELGPISPIEFIPIAEESGLIVALGQFVLRECCAQFLSWQRTAVAQLPVTMSVNVSRSELALGDTYLEALRVILKETGMPSGSLQLEVTEREIVDDPAKSRLLMQRLKATGVRLAMDDFGTGASPLSSLKDFPFDTIKIDQSFIAHVEHQQDVMMVLHATVQLIENLGMSSVAEGVEAAAQVSALQSLGCRSAQGVLFSRPVPGEVLPTVDCLAYLR
jgi:EAL domain-containing protein (putative c-di-GMP-specific phosphodiesterase class I)